MDSELGLKLTNGSKEKKVELLPLSKVSFLKRGIIFDAELGRYLCPITKKTIAKMLVAHAESTLSEADQAAIGMSNALREAALHGEEFYNSLLVRCRDVA